MGASGKDFIMYKERPEYPACDSKSRNQKQRQDFFEMSLLNYRNNRRQEDEWDISNFSNSNV